MPRLAPVTPRYATSSPAAPDDGTGTDPASLGYEQARDELLLVVQRLESGGVPLEESLALWERGETLAGTCQDYLDGARRRLEAVTNPSGPSGPSGPSDPTGPTSPPG